MDRPLPLRTQVGRPTPTNPNRRSLQENKKKRESRFQRIDCRNQPISCDGSNQRESAVVAAAQSAAEAHSAMAAARWRQHIGCGGFAGTVREWADACAFECHQRANVHVFVLGRGRRDDSATPVGTSTLVADAPPPPTTTPMATPTTSFIKLTLIFSNLCCPGINSIFHNTL